MQIIILQRANHSYAWVQHSLISQTVKKLKRYFVEKETRSSSLQAGDLVIAVMRMLTKAFSSICIGL